MFNHMESSQVHRRLVTMIVPQTERSQFVWVWDPKMPRYIYSHFPWINPTNANDVPNDIIDSSPLYKLAIEIIQSIQDLLWEGYVIRIIIHKAQKRTNEVLASSQITYDKLALDILDPSWDVTIEEIELNPNTSAIQSSSRFLGIIRNLLLTQQLIDERKSKTSHS